MHNSDSAPQAHQDFIETRPIAITPSRQFVTEVGAMLAPIAKDKSRADALEEYFLNIDDRARKQARNHLRR